MMQSIPNKDVLCKYTYLIKSLDREYLEITVYALSRAEAYDKLKKSDIYRDYVSISKCSKTVLIKAEIR